MSTENYKQIVRQFLSGNWHCDKLMSLDQFLSRDFVFHGPLGQLQGIRKFREAMMVELEVLSEFFIRVDELLAEGDRVTARYTTCFQNCGEYMYAYPSGKTITFEGISIHRIENERIAEMWDQYDRLAILGQIGGIQMLSRKDEAAIRRIVDDFHGIAFLDTEVHANLLYADDAELMPDHGPIAHGRQAIIKWLDDLPPLSDWRVSELKIDGAGSLAHVSGSYSVLVSPPDGDPFPDSGKFIQIWRKQADGSWRIVKDIFNSDLPIRATARV